MLKIKAIGVSEGLARAKALVIRDVDLTVVRNTVTDIEAEQQRALEAVENAKAQIAALRDETEKNIGPKEAEIFDAHLMMLEDPDFVEGMTNEIADESVCAEFACMVNCENFQAMFRALDDEYMQARAADIGDISQRVIKNLKGIADNAIDTITEPCIVVANDLTPSDTAKMGGKPVVGFITKIGGRTSHSAIMARSMGIPAVVGAGEKLDPIEDGMELLIDGAAGELIVQPDEETLVQFAEKKAKDDERRAMLAAFRDRPGETSDGRRIIIEGNIGTPGDAVRVMELGGEGVGLFRSEFLFMDRDALPTEEEQFAAYKAVAEACGSQAVIVRTMDIGGDKPVDYLNIPAEANPFLGYRAVRIYEEYASLFTTQLRSILRASAHGSLKIMIPMISSMEEILWVKEKLAEAKQQLRNEHIPFDEKIQLGIMLEVPSVMFIIDQCCEEIDFFSIGSNDLTQYLLAVDRDNAKVTRHYNSLNPAFLRALDYAVQAVHRQGKWIGLCGELGAKGSVLPLLVGLGLDELSMSAPSIPAAKARMAQLDSRECRKLLNQAMACRTSLEVEHLLAQFRMTQQDAPLVTAECITLESDWRSKEEVLKGMTDNLLLAGRCRYPRKLEADLWAREAVFSTGLGFSFAIPHSKSEHIEQSTISVARLQAPVRWGDDEAQFIIMLTLNKHAAGDQHMRIFSRLARRIMHEEFRNALVNAASADAIASLLQHELEL